MELVFSRFGRTSLVIAAKVQSVTGDVLFAEGDTRLVRLDPATFRPAAWSDRFRSLIEPLVRPVARSVVEEASRQIGAR